jgi:hypothetical protein
MPVEACGRAWRCPAIRCLRRVTRARGMLLWCGRVPRRGIGGSRPFLLFSSLKPAVSYLKSQVSIYSLFPRFGLVLRVSRGFHESRARVCQFVNLICLFTNDVDRPPQPVNAARSPVSYSALTGTRRLQPGPSPASALWSFRQHEARVIGA